MEHEWNAGMPEDGIGTMEASYEGGFPCAACNDDGLDASGSGAWECACTLAPAYDCGTDGAATIRVSVMLDAKEGSDGSSMRNGHMRCRLRDPRIRLTSVMERPIEIAEHGNGSDRVTAETVVGEIMRSLVPENRNDVIAWASRFGSVPVQQTLKGYGDWWRRHGAADAIRAAVGDDARFDIDHSDTYRFPMGAHAIVYSGIGAFDVWARLDGDARVTVTRC